MNSKIENQIHSMKQQINSLRSAVISIIGKDKEGKYRPEFVKKTLQASREEASFVFRNSEQLLRQMRNFTR